MRVGSGPSPSPPTAAASPRGAEAEGTRPIPGLRALFVQYPGSYVAPPWAARCERWESLAHDDFPGVAGALGRLLG